MFFRHFEDGGLTKVVSAIDNTKMMPNKKEFRLSND